MMVLLIQTENLVYQNYSWRQIYPPYLNFIPPKATVKHSPRVDAFSEDYIYK